MSSNHLFNLRAWALAGAAVAAISSPAYAQATRSYDIPAQPLATALEAFGRQSGYEVMFDRAQTAGKTSTAIRGSYTPQDALVRLITGTGMRIEQVNGSTFVVRLAGQGASAAVSANPTDVAEVLVTGSRLQSNPNEVEVRQYDKEVIARSGQTSVANFLNTLPEVSVRSLGNTFTNYGAQDGVRLRGLPAGSTLVLLDGRRVSTSALGTAEAFDLNLLPTVLVERIDVLPVGSSAIYGSDAIGGVVNIVTRQRYEGLQLEASYGFAKQYEEKRLGLMWGLERDALNVVVGLAANTRDALYGFDREASADNNYAPYGFLDFRTRDCRPGTVRAASGVLNGVGTNTATIPLTGANNRANYTAGAPPLCSYYAMAPSVPRQTAASGLLSAQYRLRDELTLYTQNLAAYTTNDTFRVRNASAKLVPASNAFNPFGQDVIVDTLWPVLVGNKYSAWTYRPLVGVRGDLGGGWDFDVAVWTSRLRERIEQHANNNSAEQPALLASSDPRTALNLFDPSANDPALLRQAFTYLTDQAWHNQVAASGVVRGAVFALPAGDLEVAAGGELQTSEFNSVAFNSGLASQRLETRAKRRTQALFAEFNAPLIGSSRDEPLLSLSGAGRYDHYSDFGGAFTPQVALEFRPWAGFSIRANYSEAFKAPGLGDSGSSRTTSEATGLSLDPKRNELLGTVRYHVGGNSGLGPETGVSKSITLRWEPPSVPGMQTSATFFRITEDNRIVLPTPTTILQYEDQFPARVIRGPSADGRPGPVTDIDFSYLNYGGLLVEGVDFSARYRVETDHGVFSPFISLTRTTKYISQVNVGLPFEDRLSKASMSDVWAPKLKATAGLSWRGDSASATVQARYTSRYLDYQFFVPTKRELGDFVLWDLSAQWDLGRASGWDVASGTTLRVNITNVLDQKLKFSQFSVLGYDPQQYDFIGRLASVTLTKEF